MLARQGAPLRVALLSYRSKPHCGGQGVYVRHLSRELAAQGHHVEVLSGPPYPALDLDRDYAGSLTLTEVPSLDLYRDDDPFRTPPLREWGGAIGALEVMTMWTGGFPEPLTFSLRAARLLAERRGEFDVVHDNQSLGYGLLGIRALGLPLVTTVHHPITVDREVELTSATGVLQRLSKRRWYAFARMQGRVARHAGRIITVSGSSAADIRRDFDVAPHQLDVVPVGVDTALFTPPSAPRMPGRIVAVSSSDSPMKGVPVLLEAVAKLRTGRDVELVVVGRPKPDGLVERTVDHLGIRDLVRFVSGLPDAALAELLGSAEVAVVPSLYEGFSLPALEAMACGTPLAVSRAGALPEVVGPDGECAVHVTPGSSGELADAVGALLDDPARRTAMGLAARARVETGFSWGAVAARTVAVYRDVIATATLPC